MKVLALMLIIVLLKESAKGSSVDLLSDEFIESINKEQSLWRAGRNFAKNIPISYLKGLLGLRLPEDRFNVLPQFRPNVQDIVIPESFDWREQFPNCSTIGQIRDQGSCASCWAFASVEAISDRICIHSQGKTDVQISANNLVACCESCGSCRGGDMFQAFKYWKDVGIVTGGVYNSAEGCQPYEFPPCDHIPRRSLPKCGDVPNTPQCKDTCESGYPKSYQEDLYFGKSAYRLSSDVKEIQAEIMQNGPVVRGIDVYKDFYTYKVGIYRHHKGDKLGSHAIKILGWGFEDGTPYWLVANSWNADWGLNGYIKILRGEDESKIESYICAGIPA